MISHIKELLNLSIISEKELLFKLKQCRAIAICFRGEGAVHPSEPIILSELKRRKDLED